MSVYEGEGEGEEEECCESERWPVLADRPARQCREPGNMAYSPGYTHSKALASAAKSG